MALIHGASLSLGGGLMVLAYDAFVWLKSGERNNILVLDAIYRWLPETMRTWLMNPTDWLGAAEAIWYVLKSPLAAFLLPLFIPMWLLAFAVFGAFERFSEGHQARWNLGDGKD